MLISRAPTLRMPTLGAKSLNNRMMLATFHIHIIHQGANYPAIVQYSSVGLWLTFEYTE